MASTKKQKTRYELRNKLHEPLGLFTHDELIAAISEGNYSGEEEIALEDKTDWQKIASHPAFYDAFLRRLFTSEYQGKSKTIVRQITDADTSIHEDKDSKQASSVGKKAAATVAKQGTRTEQALPRGESSPLPPENLGQTIHQSDIEKLFQEGNSKSKSVPPPKKEVWAAEESIKTLFEKEQTAELPKIPLNVHGESVEGPAKIDSGRKINKRVVMWGGVLSLTLLLLFQMGQGTQKSGVVSNHDAPGFLLLRGKETEPETKKALLAALEEEAIFFLSNDGFTYVAGAMATAEEGLALEPNNIRFLGLFAVAGASQVAEGSGNEALASRVREVIEKGRAEDLHNSLFYRAEAILAMGSKEWKVAREKIQSAKESDPLSFGNLLIDAELDLQAGKVSEASAKLTEIIQNEPNNVRARYLLGRSFVERNQLAPAWEQALAALGWNPLYANGYYLLGEVQSKKNLLKEARLSFDLATRFGRFGTQDTVALAHARLGDLLQIMGKASDAEKSYALAYTYAPEKYTSYKDKLGNPSRTEREKILNEWVYEHNFYRERGDELLRKKKYPEALRFYQADRLLQPNDASTYVRVGQILERVVTSKEQIQRVMLLYERGALKDPSNVAPYIRLGMLETEQYNFERAYQLLDFARSLNDQNGEVFVALGKHFYKRQDYVTAKEFFTRALVIDPTSGEAEYYQAMISRLYDKEELREPMRRFYRAYTLDPENYQALAEYLKLRVLNYEKTFAVKFLRSLIEGDPRNAELHWALGEVYASNSEPRRAVEHYKKGLDIDPTNSRLRMALARARAATSEFEAAVDEFRKAAELDLKNNDGRFEAAKLLLELQRYDLAELELQKILERTPNYPGVHRYLSKVYQSVKRKDISAEKLKEMALREMEIEVENSPRNTRFILELATLYMAYGKFDKAIPQLSEVANLPPENKAPEYKKERMRAFLLLSVCYRALNKPDNAEGAVRLALTLDPNEPELHRELGYVYHAQQRHYEAKDAFDYYLNRVPAATDADEIRAIIKKTVGD